MEEHLLWFCDTDWRTPIPILLCLLKNAYFLLFVALIEEQLFFVFCNTQIEENLISFCYAEWRIFIFRQNEKEANFLSELNTMLRVGRAVQLTISLSFSKMINDWVCCKFSSLPFGLLDISLQHFPIPYCFTFAVTPHDQLLLLVALNAVVERSRNGGTRGQAASHSPRSGETRDIYCKEQLQSAMTKTKTRGDTDRQ